MISQDPLVFGPFRLDPVSGRLCRGQRPVHVTPKALAVLEYLLKNAGRLVTKEELLGAIWADSFATDASLKVCVREVRKALHDTPAKPRYIETAHRRGYRFIAPVHTEESTPSGGNHANNGVADLAQTSSPQPTLVGREAELRVLQARLELARQGQRQVVFVTGEPGSGKSTLMEAFLAGAAQQGLCVTTGQCFEQFGRGEAYLPLREALGHLEQELGSEVVAGLLRKHAPAWPAETARQPHRDDSRAETLGATAERLLRELAEFLEALSAQTPLVLLLEDLHWCDYSTLDLISALARRRAPARLLLVATYRPVDVILSEHPLRAVKQELLAHKLCTELPLPPLGEAAVADYLGQHFPGQAIAAGLARQLHERTGGLPLFLVHLVEYLHSHAVLVVTETGLRLVEDLQHLQLEIPEGVRPLIDKQIERLTAEECRLLEGASVAGVEFAAAALAAALDLDVVAVEDRCEALVQRQLFLEAHGASEWPDGTVSTCYRFRHDLYQRAFSARVPAARGVRLHLKLAECLEASHGEKTADIAAALAVHFEQGRDQPRAIRYLRQAAEQATRSYANREAVDTLQRALRHVDNLPAVERNLVRMALLEQSGLVRRASNDMTGAVADFQALRVCAGNALRVEDEARALLFLASVLSWLDRAGCLEAVAQVQALSSQLEDPVPQAHTRAWAAYFHLLWCGWNEADVTACFAAIEATRRAGKRTLLGPHLVRGAFYQALRAEYLAASETVAEGAQLALESGDASDYLLARFFEAWIQLHRGHWGAMHRVLQDATDIAEKNGHGRWLVLFRLELAWLHLQALDFARARDLCQEALRLAEQQGFPFALLMGRILLGSAHLGLGEPAAALAAFDSLTQWLERERILMDWLWKLPLHLGLGEYWLSQHDYPRARHHGEELCRQAAASGERTYQALGWRLQAEAALAQQNATDAAATLGQALDLIQNADLPLAAWRIHGTAARWHEQQGRPDEAHSARTRQATLLTALADSLGSETPLGSSFASAQASLVY